MPAGSSDDQEESTSSDSVDSSDRDALPDEIQEVVNEVDAADVDTNGTDRDETATEEREWRFSLEDLEDEEPEGNVAGSLERAEPLEPQEIDLENAVFVLAGVLLTLGLLASVIVSF